MPDLHRRPGPRHHRAASWVAALLATVTLTGCGLLGGAGPTTPPSDGTTPPGSSAPVSSAPPATPAQLAEAITADAVLDHLDRWQEIAEAKGGNRAAGSPGHRASLAHARDTLTRAGYAVTEQTFPFTDTSVEAQTAQLVGGPALDLPIVAMQGTPSTPAAGVEGIAVAPRDPLGCRAADYPDATGAIAVARRGTCPFAVKAEAASAAGASALLVVDSEGGDRRLVGTLGAGGAERTPTAGISQAAGGRLLEAIGTGPVRLRVAVVVRVEQREGVNLIAEGPATPGDDRVVMAGAHLDSVAEGPGINDNGSGSALVLETAVQLARLGEHAGTRFAFWDAEELGLIGSRHYVDTLDDAGRERIAAYLNFDMVTSPNGVPQSYGDAGIRRRFERVFADQDRPLDAARIGGASDHAPFEAAGIPIGGLFTGAGESPSPAQAREWGVTEGRPMDPCYHQACDAVPGVVTEQTTARLELIADATIITVADLVRTGR